MKKIGSIFLVTLLMTSLLGCGVNPGGDGSTGKRVETQQYGNGSTVNRILRIGNNSAPDGTYDNDGYLGYTWSTPNLGIGRNDVNYGVLTDYAAQTAESVPGVDNATANINGGTMIVDIDVARSHRENPQRVRQHVQEVISREMPRFDVRVNLNGSPGLLRSRYLGEGDNDRFRKEFRGEVDNYRYEMRSNLRK